MVGGLKAGEKVVEVSGATDYKIHGSDQSAGLSHGSDNFAISKNGGQI